MDPGGRRRHQHSHHSRGNQSRRAGNPKELGLGRQGSQRSGGHTRPAVTPAHSLTAAQDASGPAVKTGLRRVSSNQGKHVEFSVKRPQSLARARDPGKNSTMDSHLAGQGGEPTWSVYVQELSSGKAREGVLKTTKWEGLPLRLHDGPRARHRPTASGTFCAHTKPVGSREWPCALW